jgi:hypothetical protein
MLRQIAGRLLVRAGRALLEWEWDGETQPPREVIGRRADGRVVRRAGQVGFTERSLRMVEPPEPPPEPEAPEPPLRGSIEAQRRGR